MARESLDFVQAKMQKEGKIGGPNGEQVLYSFDEVKLMASVPRPNIFWDCMVFLEHFQERWAKRGLSVPDVFYKSPAMPPRAARWWLPPATHLDPPVHATTGF
jgi:hypothetical protein